MNRERNPFSDAHAEVRHRPNPGEYDKRVVEGGKKKKRMKEVCTGLKCFADVHKTDTRGGASAHDPAWAVRGWHAVCTWQLQHQLRGLLRW